MLLHARHLESMMKRAIHTENWKLDGSYSKTDHTVHRPWELVCGMWRYEVKNNAVLELMGH